MGIRHCAILILKLLIREAYTVDDVDWERVKKDKTHKNLRTLEYRSNIPLGIR